MTMPRPPDTNDPSRDPVASDEYSPLLGPSPGTDSSISSDGDAFDTPSQAETSSLTIWAVLPTLLLGVFIAQADSSIVLATSQEISSRFAALSDAAWLITTYSLAQCACQPLYGKTSDIFGRKPVLLFAYAIFAFGCFLCGIGTKYWHVLAGRAISGIGGAGMVGLVAVIVADLLPPRQVAQWRSYVNVIATLGRSCGGPTGGWLVDNVGWRWCFYGQSPIAVLAVLLIIWRLPSSTTKKTTGLGEAQPFRAQIARIDIAGFITLPCALIASFLALDLAGKLYPWTYIVPLGSVALALFIAFYYIEKYHAAEPIIPMALLGRRDVWIPYLLIALQTSAQFFITYTIPMYFQVVTGMSVTAAGSRIVVIVVGNSVAGLLSGWIISRTGRYKLLTLAANVFANSCYILVLVRWRGNSGWLDTWYVVLGGLGMGTTQSTTFVHLAACLEAKDIAIAGTTWFLSQGIGALVAANIFNLVHNLALTNLLVSALEGNENRDKIIEGASSSVDYILGLPPDIRHVVRKAFIASLVPTNACALGCGMLSLCVALCMRGRKLDAK